MYRQVLDLYATSVDYNPHSEESVRFFKIVQNKLHYAAHGHTAAEVIKKQKIIFFIKKKKKKKKK